jgi:hypothetical protein
LLVGGLADGAAGGDCLSQAATGRNGALKNRDFPVENPPKQRPRPGKVAFRAVQGYMTAAP